ncbi:MAG: hypothetical protein C4327_06715 [Meiothermus sp.]
MSERERIGALLEAGKITQDEAKLLYSALEEADQAVNEADRAVNDAVGSSDDAAAGKAGFREEAPPQTSGDLRWVKVRLMAGALEAKLDQSLSQPRIEGSAEVRQVGQDLEVTPRVGGSFLGILSNVGPVEMRLPPGWGLDVDTKAAQIEAEGIAFLKGRVAAGNVELDEVEGLDLEVTAGNIEGSLLLREGSHRLRVTMGNAELDLEEGSSARVTSSVSMGNLETKGHFAPGSGYSDKQVGDGKATLEVSVRMGNLEIKAK